MLKATTYSSSVKIADRKLPQSELLFFLVWTRYTIWKWVEVILNQIHGFENFTPYLFPFLFISVIMFTFSDLIKKITILDIAVILFFVALWFISKSQSMEYVWAFNNNQEAFFYALSMIIVGKLTVLSEKKDVFFDLLYRSSVIGVFFTASYFVYCFIAGRTAADNNMDLAYKLLPSVLCVLGFAINKGRYFRWLTAGFSVVFIVLLGTRGPIVTILIFILFMLFLVTKSKRTKIYHITLGIAFLFLDALFDFFTLIVKILIRLAESLHLSTRVLDSLLTASFFESSGRVEIQARLFEVIPNKFFGHGLFSDRYYTVGLWGRTEGVYAHNIVIEMWINFGYLIGTLAIAFLAILALKNLMSKKNSREEKTWCAILFCCGFVKLLFSGVWLVEPYLFMFVGFCFAMLKRNKRTKREIKLEI